MRKTLSATLSIEPPEGVGNATAEVDHPVGQLTVGVAEVDDHRLAGAEPVGDLLGIGELRGRGDVALWPWALAWAKA